MKPLARAKDAGSVSVCCTAGSRQTTTGDNAETLRYAAGRFMARILTHFCNLVNYWMQCLTSGTHEPIFGHYSIGRGKGKQLK
jgi:hypothetical protein